MLCLNRSSAVPLAVYSNCLTVHQSFVRSATFSLVKNRGLISFRKYLFQQTTDIIMAFNYRCTDYIIANINSVVKDLNLKSSNWQVLHGQTHFFSEIREVHNSAKENIYTNP